MRLSWLFSLPAVLSTASALAIQKRDADFYSVRTHMHKDMSGKKGDPTEKYFHESVFHPHYDGRFADHQLGYRERKQALSNLIQTYLATFSDIGVETWLMHGTLLGWWWNRKILPWDSDSDVQVSEASMHYLASYYNMSVFHYKTPRIPEGRDYMLEINPHYVNREQSDKLNVIDARWVDTTSGLFIDITTARYNLTHPAGAGMLSCKDGHEYRDSYIFPLRDTYFEDTPAKIPFAYKEILEAEYQQKALTNTDFEGHHFDDQKYEWIPVPAKVEPEKQQPKREDQKKEVKKDGPAKKPVPAQDQQQARDAPKAPDQQAVAKKDESAPPASQKPVESSPDKGEVSKRAQPQQPAAQRAAEEKLSKKEEKRELLRKKTEEKRKAAEEKAIAKEEKRLASQKKADEKRAAATGNKAW
ncbi:LicD family-domain-containing protein [Cadophora sp. MPI-SDFR-AT-0126]|nr:LicD family-domain-containing protein [Leotiomycetes sp. MPI-SDFR-AT-0126]